MVNTAYALNAYTQIKATTATNPVDLVIMLYNGAIDFLDKAATSIEMRNLQIKIRYIDRALAIIEELDTSLNFEAGGQVAANLTELYQYIMIELVRANLENDAEKIKHLSNLLKNIREAWVHIKDQV